MRGKLFKCGISFFFLYKLHIVIQPWVIQYHPCSLPQHIWTVGNLLLSDLYSSFELNMFELDRSHLVLCAVVYRPKYNKDFISDFSDFLAGIMPKYDWDLIVWDFNIHVCCHIKLLVKGCLNLIDSSNLVQSVSGPTQEHGHKGILSWRLTVLNIEVCNAVFSDHTPVLFETSLPCHIVKPFSSLLFV